MGTNIKKSDVISKSFFVGFIALNYINMRRYVFGLGVNWLRFDAQLLTVLLVGEN